MKVTKVIIEGFHNIHRGEYSFDDVNYLYGRNGAGKSTALQAVQLGLLGYVPGTNKTKQGVFTHANSRAMAIKVILDDNGQKISIERIWTMSKNSVSEEINIDPEGYDIKSLIEDVELPLFNFDEFSHMTANGLKDWFINYLPKSEFKTDWSAQLHDAVKDLPASAVDETFINDSIDAIQSLGQQGVEEIRSANSYFKNQLTFMKQELTRKTSTIQSLIHYDDFEATMSEEELKMLISSTESKIVQASIAKQNADRIKALKQELTSLEGSDVKVQTAVDQLNKLGYDAGEIINAIKTKEKEYADLCAELKSSSFVVSSKGICPYTQTACDSISKLVDTYSDRVAELNDQIKNLENELTEMQKRKSALDGQISIFNTQLASYQNDARRYEQVKKELEILPAAGQAESIDWLQVQLNQYKEEYGKAAANRQYNELSAVVLQDKYRIENSIECLKLWVKLTDVNGLQASGGDVNPFDALADHIDAVLDTLFTDKNVKCKFNSDGKANSFSFGIDRDGVYVPYSLLSSGEKCLFVLSMYIGLLNYTKSPLKLILIDDFLDHLDDENFDAVFKTLHSCKDTQFIFAGVKPVSDENCKVIHLA